MTLDIDPRIEYSSEYVTDSNMFHIRLVNNRQYFWVLILHHNPDTTELYDITDSELPHLFSLINNISKALKITENADKINIGALGNIVPQFHFHIIARHQNDPAWPGPVWGTGEAGDCSDDELLRRKKIILDAISGQ